MPGLSDLCALLCPGCVKNKKGKKPDITNVSSKMPAPKPPTSSSRQQQEQTNKQGTNLATASSTINSGAASPPVATVSADVPASSDQPGSGASPQLPRAVPSVSANPSAIRRDREAEEAKEAKEATERRKTHRPLQAQSALESARRRSPRSRRPRSRRHRHHHRHRKTVSSSRPGPSPGRKTASSSSHHVRHKSPAAAAGSSREQKPCKSVHHADARISTDSKKLSPEIAEDIRNLLETGGVSDLSRQNKHGPYIPVDVESLRKKHRTNAAPTNSSTTIDGKMSAAGERTVSAGPIRPFTHSGESGLKSGRGLVEPPKDNLRLPRNYKVDAEVVNLKKSPDKRGAPTSKSGIPFETRESVARDRDVMKSFEAVNTSFVPPKVTAQHQVDTIPLAESRQSAKPKPTRPSPETSSNVGKYHEALQREIDQHGDRTEIYPGSQMQKGSAQKQWDQVKEAGASAVQPKISGLRPSEKGLGAKTDLPERLPHPPIDFEKVRASGARSPVQPQPVHARPEDTDPQEVEGVYFHSQEAVDQLKRDNPENESYAYGTQPHQVDRGTPRLPLERHQITSQESLNRKEDMRPSSDRKYSKHLATGSKRPLQQGSKRTDTHRNETTRQPPRPLTRKTSDSYPTTTTHQTRSDLSEFEYRGRPSDLSLPVPRSYESGAKYVGRVVASPAGGRLPMGRRGEPSLRRPESRTTVTCRGGTLVTAKDFRKHSLGKPRTNMGDHGYLAQEQNTAATNLFPPVHRNDPSLLAPRGPPCYGRIHYVNRCSRQNTAGGVPGANSPGGATGRGRKQRNNQAARPPCCY